MLVFLLFLFLHADAAWKGVGYAGYATMDNARQACLEYDDDTDTGFHLCTPSELLYTAYYDNTAVCFAGWLDTDNDAFDHGWFNYAEGGCGSNAGWNEWNPPNGQWGAHCCSDDSASLTTFQTCGEYSCAVGTVDFEYENVACTGMDGCVTDEECGCSTWAPATSYTHIAGYQYSSGEEAEARCQQSHEDLHVCDELQVEGAAVNGGAEVCSSGWYIDQDGVYQRGWYVSEAFAENNCDNIAGWRTWAPSNGKGSVHCCVATYAKSSWANLEVNPAAAAAWCQEKQYYATSLCRKTQLETIAKYENTEICQSAWVENVDEEAGDNNHNFAGYEVGWYQGNADTDTCWSTEGWNSYVAPTPDAHCCVDWVLDSVNEIYEYVVTPDFYSGSTFTNGAAANAECLDMGYTGGVCTMAQQAYTAENPAIYGTAKLVVGWVTDESGAYATGFWNPSTDAWVDYGVSNPLLHCCQTSVPELDGVYGEAGDYGNSGFPYSFSDYASAESYCLAKGFIQVCSRDQLEYAATIGVNDAVYDDICFQGYMSDGSAGWYNGGGGCGSTGWNYFNAAAFGVHCCSDFEAILSVAAFKKIDPYTYTSEADALAGCQSENENYVLCSDNELFHVANYGVLVPDSLAGDYGDVEPQTNLCFSGWVDSSRSCQYEGGWWQVEDVGSGCGAANTWGKYFPKSTGAGAFCCISEAINADGVFCDQSLPVFAMVGGRDYDNAADALAACEAEDPLYQLCSDNELYFVATEGVTVDGVEGIAGIDAQTSLCNPGWVDPDRSAQYESGWYQVDTTNGGCGKEGWNTWMDNGFGSAFCCVSDYINQDCVFCPDTATPTEIPTMTPTMVPTEPTITTTSWFSWSDLPSTIPWVNQDNCLSFVPEGFEGHIEYCVYDDGIVYLNGRSTCISEDNYASTAALEAAIESAFNDNWYFAAEDFCDKTYDEATQDQLWVTNEMIDNLEEDVQALETSLNIATGELDVFIEDWKQEIVDLINDYIESFDTETQASLNDFIDNL